MKSTIPKAVVALSALSAVAATAGEFVVEKPAEFHLAGDWNGDGNIDFAVVDKSTGLYRAGVNAGGGTFVVGDAQPSGLTGVTGAGAGPLLNASRDALVLASPTGNRLHVFDPVPYGAELNAVYAAGIGPSQVAVVDIPGTGQAQPGEDIVSLALWEGFGTPRLRQLRNSAGGMTAVSTTPLAAGGAGFNPVRLRPALPQMLGLVDGSGEAFSVYELDADAAPAPVAAVTGLPSGSMYAHGEFDGTFNDFFFYVPGSPNVLASRAAPDGLGFQFEAPAGHTLAGVVGSLSVIRGAGDDLVAMVTDDGAELQLYSYTKAGGFVLLQSIAAGEGEAITGVVPTGATSFQLLAGDGGEGITRRASYFAWNGSSFAEGDSEEFSPAKYAAGLANVFQFRQEPFVAAGATLLRTGVRLDWSTAFSLSGAPGDVIVSTESFAGEAAGLGSPVSVNLGAAHPLTTHGLVNQIDDTIAVFAYDPVKGDVPEWVSIDPPGGDFDNAVAVALKARSPSTAIFYRVDGGPFLGYTAPVYLFRDGTFEFFGQTPAGERTPVRPAEFRFSLPPEKQDRDGDGVPDFAEIAAGTIGEVTADFDGDGFSDAQELVAGSDPTLATSTPAGGRADSGAALRIDVTPWPYDGFALTETLAVDDVAVRAFDADGVFLAYGTTNTGLAPLEVVPFEPLSRFGLVTTEKHFEIDTAQADKHLGRELVGVVPFVAAAPPENPFVYDAMDPLATNAANWLAGAAPFLFPAPSPVALDLDRYHVLKLVLFECLIGEAFTQRGAAFADPVSLTPHRGASESGYAHPGLDALRAMERPDPNGGAASPPSFLPGEIYRQAESAVDAPVPTTGMVALRNLVTELFEISSSQNNSNPASYPLPLDALRAFANNGAPPSPYDAEVTLGAPDLAAALAEVGSLKAALAARPVVTLTLEVPPAGAGQPGPAFEDCSLLQTPDASATYALIDGEGLPFPLPAGFMLEPGSQATVTAFADRGPYCGVATLEVISIGVQFLPTPSAADGDGNLLADAWEELFFGGAGVVDPLASQDGSGYSALQQFLEGTDPTDPNSVPAGAAMDLSLPSIDSAFDANGDIVITWQWGNDAIAPLVVFLFSDSQDLDGFSATAVTGVHLGGGSWTATIPAPGSARYFFRASIGLASGP